MNCKILISCGTGGVGKTTLSAGFALKAAHEGQRVAVLTIDPARRLADSLKIGKLSNDPVRVPIEGIFLDAMMLEPAKTFNDFTKKYAKSPRDAELLVQNRYYKFASKRMGGVLEYTALLKLIELYDSGLYDLIVLDTPPAINAIDFFAAPSKITGMFEQKALKWMSNKKTGWGALGLGTEILAKGLKIFLGNEMIDDLGDFFDSFSAISEKMAVRSKECASLLTSEQSKLLLITSADRDTISVLDFLDALQKANLTLGAFCINRSPAPYTETQLDLIPAELTGFIKWSQTVHSNALSAHAKLRAELKKQGDVFEVYEQKEAPSSIQGLTKICPMLPSVAQLW